MGLGKRLHRGLVPALPYSYNVPTGINIERSSRATNERMATSTFLVQLILPSSFWFSVGVGSVLCQIHGA